MSIRMAPGLRREIAETLGHYFEARALRRNLPRG